MLRYDFQENIDLSNFRKKIKYKILNEYFNEAILIVFKNYKINIELNNAELNNHYTAIISIFNYRSKDIPFSEIYPLKNETLKDLTIMKELWQNDNDKYSSYYTFNNVDEAINKISSLISTIFRLQYMDTYV